MKWFALKVAFQDFRIKTLQFWLQIKKNFSYSFEACDQKKNKTGEFTMTHQAKANRYSLFSRMAPVVASILSWR